MDNKGPKETPIPAIGVGGLVFNRKGQVLLVARRNPPEQENGISPAAGLSLEKP